MIFRLDFVVQVAELNETCNVRITIVAKKQQVLHIMRVCVCVCVVLVIQRVTRMRRIILLCVASPAVGLQYFPTFSDKGQDFRKKLLNAKCVFFLYNCHLKRFEL